MTQPTLNSPSVAAGIPTLAIVGRPNVGKSTLFNRLVGSRRAIVGDEPGITRDRLYGEAEWRGRHMRVVDTGGILPEDTDFIPSEIFRQAKVALKEAAAVIMVVDGRSELAAPDLELARLLIRSGKSLFLAVNKMDSGKQKGLAEEFHRLGIRKLFPISAEHGRGVDDLLDAVLEILPPGQEKTEAAAEVRAVALDVPEITAGAETFEGSESASETQAAAAPREIRIAIIGHPNVSKSTLLNRLSGSSRTIVSPIPGTTRDAVDELVQRDGNALRFIDTAGIRRKGK